MKRILIPTDFSPNAQKAADYAVRLFSEESEMVLVHSYQIPHSGANVLISVQDILEKDALKLLETEKARIVDLFPGAKTSLSIEARLGEPQEVLRRMITEKETDLVVMGTQGATGLKGILVGSVASSVLERVNAPIMAIPMEAELHLPKSIAFAADDESLNGLNLPSIVNDLAVKHASHVHVLNVVGKDESRTVGVSDSTSAKPIDSLENVQQTYHFLEDDDVVHGIDAFLEKHQVDLLSLINRKQDLFSMLFNRSVTKQMILHSKTPILAIPQN